MATPEPAIVSVELAAGHEPVELRWEPVATEDGGSVATESPWELESEPDWSRLEGIRLVSARFEDGAVLGVAALRPREARGHGDDVVIARLIDADGEETATTDALVSVEYDAAGTPRRLGIELWLEPDSAPRRVAADREAESEARSAEGRNAVAMRFRLDGTGGSGLYEVLRPN
jgi:hypothetical protein